MRRFLLTAAAAGLVMLAACSEGAPDARAFADDGERVRLLSSAETAQVSLPGASQAACRAESGDDAQFTPLVRTTHASHAAQQSAQCEQGKETQS
ncbi:MAG: hypothetical protein RKE49_08955 [Oceanicaulis sp.]